MNKKIFFFLIAATLLSAINNLAKSNNILTVSIQNQTVQYDHTKGKYYFKFDVYVNANDFSTYLDNVSLRLNYNTTAFGTNIKANNKVEVSMGDEFNDFTYNLSNYVSDASPNSLYLGCGAGLVAYPARTLLTTTPEKLLAVGIELLNGLTGISSGINFTDVVNTSIASWFAPASNSPWYDTELYDATNYNTPPGFTIYTVAPTLSNFSPTTVRAGVDEILTINGANFGTQKGEVLFTRDGVASGATDFLKGLDESYIDSWTNTQIKVRVPSFVRKGYVEKGKGISGFGSGAGSGKIKVRTARNDSVISASSLHIEYSISNFSGKYEPSCYTNPICRVYLARLSDCNDVVFTLHDTFQGSSMANARNAVEAALQKWSDLLNISMVLERNSSDTDYEYAPNFANSTKNIIGFVATVSNNPALSMAVVTGEINAGVPGSSSVCAKYYRGYGSHIYIKNSIPWDYRTSGTVSSGTASFYETFMHEIGHFLNLQHVNNSSDLLYYTVGTTVTNLTPTSIPVVGATTTVTASKNITWTTINIGTLGTLGAPCGGVGFYDEVTIQDPEPGRIGYGGFTLVPNTNIIEPCSIANFHAMFVTGSTPPTYPVTFDWLIVLYHSDWTEYVYAQQTGMPANTNNPYNYTEGCFWQSTVGALPAYDWLYDPSGNIYGKVRVAVHISDGDIKYDVTDIGVAPVKKIQNTVYNTNTTISACSDIYLKDVQIQGTPTVIFNMNGYEITIDETFNMPVGATFIINP